ncbi:hypothetical protein DFH29DRAFT_786338, partial [Suillus ampliporus]
DLATADNDDDDSVQVELDELSEEVDREDAEMIAEDDGLNDNDDGWVNEMDELADNERSMLEASILPVKLALVKVRKLAYKIIHSTTVILPAWRKILKDLKFTVMLMPRDVSTHWNSTLDMLEYALKHRIAVNMVTQRRVLGL